MKGHRSIVNQVRYNKHNNLIASSGVEKMIKLWSAISIGEFIIRFYGLVASVWNYNFRYLEWVFAERMFRPIQDSVHTSGLCGFSR